MVRAPFRRALIVGASGGIGAALAGALAAGGTDGGTEVETLSRSRDGLDLTRPETVARAFAALEGPFDLVIVAAGILAPQDGRPEKSLSEIDAGAMAQVMVVNAIGPALILAQLPALLPRSERAVVAVLTARVGSIGDNHLGGWYSYRASKAAANQVVRTAAIEIARRHKEACVIALHPGTVETAFTQGYPRQKKTPADAAAQNLLSVLGAVTPADTGGFFDWQGKPVPW